LFFKSVYRRGKFKLSGLFWLADLEP
jgi:hypothetical protein